jgi:hypothetical protein
VAKNVFIPGDLQEIHSGRPAGNFGLPVSLFNHALGRFDYHLRHLDDESFPLDLPPTLVELAHMFMETAASCYPDGSTRTAAMKNIFDWIIGGSSNWEVSQTRFGIRPDAINPGDIPFFVMEVKNEAGLEGDVTFQAALSYAHIATSLVGPVRSSYVHYDCHPFLLIWIVGFIEAIGPSRHSFELSRRSLRYHG